MDRLNEYQKFDIDISYHLVKQETTEIVYLQIVIRKQDAFFLTENEAIDRNSTCWRNDDVRVSRASKPASGNP